MLRVAERAVSPSGFRTPARHVALSTALWTAHAHSVVCACAQLLSPYPFIACPEITKTQLSEGGRKGRGETQENGRGWTLGAGLRSSFLCAPPLRPRVFPWVMCLQLSLAVFKGQSDERELYAAS